MAKFAFVRNLALKSAIWASGRPQVEVGFAARISETRMSNLVRGKFQPTRQECTALARVLGTSVAALFPPQEAEPDEDEAPPAPPATPAPAPPRRRRRRENGAASA